MHIYVLFSIILSYKTKLFLRSSNHAAGRRGHDSDERGGGGGCDWCAFVARGSGSAAAEGLRRRPQGRRAQTTGAWTWTARRATSRPSPADIRRLAQPRARPSARPAERRRCHSVTWTTLHSPWRDSWLTRCASKARLPARCAARVASPPSGPLALPLSPAEEALRQQWEESDAEVAAAAEGSALLEGSVGRAPGSPLLCPVCKRRYLSQASEEHTPRAASAAAAPRRASACALPDALSL